MSANGSIVVESAESVDWASLTFAGVRHHIVVRLPLGTVPVNLATADLDPPGVIIAVEDARWEPADDGLRLTLALLTIDAPTARYMSRT